ncbi:MAG: DUF4406 domain-containing protein [Prevotellaceae bacterium]|jgi:hypothetical protein|nr:DUF4406 domain-containing protein [Prevotellaceae bacterium]
MEVKEDKRIYISGAISGLDYGTAKAKFQNAETRLLTQGWIDIANPMKCKIFKRHDEWSWQMGACLMMLLRCEAIYMLRDWSESKGARIEHAVATELGIEIIYQL